MNRFNSGQRSMRIAVAGTGGLACLIALSINEETTHNVVLLSRSAKPHLTSRGLQILVVDYNDPESLAFALRGIETVISTVTGANQIPLIKAAVASKVRRFAPAEFEGPPQLRPANDPLDRQRTTALNWLRYFQGKIEYTVFVCGVFYERFQPGGLAAALVARQTGYDGEGAYLLNCAQMSAEVPVTGPSNDLNSTICMTSIRDVAKLVTKAIDLASWPTELHMRGERMTVRDLVVLVQKLKGRRFQPFLAHQPSVLQSEIAAAVTKKDWSRFWKLQTLVATAEGRYDFTQNDLDTAFPGFRFESFASWFVKKWN